MIRIDHATWTYPHAEQPSLRDLTLRINPGEFVILCGASGSGKSTALRLMNGLIPHFHEDASSPAPSLSVGWSTTNAELDAMGPRHRHRAAASEAPVLHRHRSGGGRLRDGELRLPPGRDPAPRRGDGRGARHGGAGRTTPAGSLRRSAATGRDRRCDRPPPQRPPAG
ncbi:ATP-binding cassette domain-containing protein [Salinispora arenicola]|nr:ATP-binding cassette domain-containing protein [Salinispora arenicola]